VMEAACGEIRSGTPPARNVNFIFFFLRAKFVL
jgi:hypothetical protein